MRISILVRALCVMTCVCAQMGCAVPLGTSSYPAVSPEGIEGRWAASVMEDGEWDDSEFDVLVSRAEHEDDSSSLIELLTDGSVDKSPRYRLEFVPPESTSPEADGESLLLEGQFLQTQGKLLFTFQGDLSGTDGAIRLLATPLQYTFRIEYDPGSSVILVLAHDQLLLWTPTPIQGSGSRGLDVAGSGLVGDLDAIVGYYAKSRDNKWSQIARFTRKAQDK